MSNNAPRDALGYLPKVEAAVEVRCLIILPIILKGDGGAMGKLAKSFNEGENLDSAEVIFRDYGRSTPILSVSENQSVWSAPATSASGSLLSVGTR